MSKGLGSIERKILEVLPGVVSPGTLSVEGKEPRQVQYVSSKDLCTAVFGTEARLSPSQEFHLSSVKRAAKKLAIAGRIGIFYVPLDRIEKGPANTMCIELIHTT